MFLPNSIREEGGLRKVGKKLFGGGGVWFVGLLVGCVLCGGGWIFMGWDEMG